MPVCTDKSCKVCKFANFVYFCIANLAKFANFVYFCIACGNCYHFRPKCTKFANFVSKSLVPHYRSGNKETRYVYADTIKPVFHFNRIVTYRSILFCFQVISSTLVLRKRGNTLRFATIRLKWKTGFKVENWLKVNCELCRTVQRISEKQNAKLKQLMIDSSSRFNAVGFSEHWKDNKTFRSLEFLVYWQS